MSCKCLDKIEENLTNHHGNGSDVELELKQTLSEFDSPEASFGVALPPLYYTYRSGKKRKRSFVVFNFCPFCGQTSK